MVAIWIVWHLKILKFFISINPITRICWVNDIEYNRKYANEESKETLSIFAIIPVSRVNGWSPYLDSNV